jgi:preprotein translocase subunit SecA
VVVEQLVKVRASREEPLPRRTQVAMAPRWQEARGGEAPGAPSRTEPRTASGQKVGRNDPCPCGSGKKYKKCCLLKGA